MRQSNSRDCTTVIHVQLLKYITDLVQSNSTELQDVQDRDDMRAEEIKQHLGPSGIWTQNAAAKVKEYKF
jgi:hypothetical protein